MANSEIESCDDANAMRFEEFLASPEAEVIRGLLTEVFGEEGASCELIDRALRPCYQAKVCKEDPPARQRAKDMAFRQEAKKRKIRNASHTLSQFFTEHPDQLDVSVAFLMRKWGFRVDGRPSERIGEFLSELSEVIQNEIPGAPRSMQTSGWLYRTQRYNLLYPETLDSRKRGRKLATKALCLAWEIEFLLRCWHIGIDKTRQRLLGVGTLMPDSGRRFFETAITIASLALGPADDAYISPDALSEFIRKNPNIRLMPWPDTDHF